MKHILISASVVGITTATRSLPVMEKVDKPAEGRSTTAQTGYKQAFRARNNRRTCKAIKKGNLSIFQHGVLAMLMLFCSIAFSAPPTLSEALQTSAERDAAAKADAVAVSAAATNRVVAAWATFKVAVIEPKLAAAAKAAEPAAVQAVQAATASAVAQYRSAAQAIEAAAQAATEVLKVDPAAQAAAEAELARRKEAEMARNKAVWTAMAEAVSAAKATEAAAKAAAAK